MLNVGFCLNHLVLAISHFLVMLYVMLNHLYFFADGGAILIQELQAMANEPVFSLIQSLYIIHNVAMIEESVRFIHFNNFMFVCYKHIIHTILHYHFIITFLASFFSCPFLLFLLHFYFYSFFYYVSPLIL